MLAEVITHMRRHRLNTEKTTLFLVVNNNAGNTVHNRRSKLNSLNIPLQNVSQAHGMHWESLQAPFAFQINHCHIANDSNISQFLSV